ncbi:MAG: ABC transporter ATP-binding protein [Candidatus Limnocylindrales bacterium]|jgi:putative spermidine/putrescine transport system ATP-binding protein
MARLELNKINKRFGDQVAVADFSLAVADGELVSFLGPSGCGKTTTLRMTAGFELPDSGSVIVDGVDVTDLPTNKRAMGMVFQGYALFPNMTAIENVEFGLAVRGRPVAERRAQVAELLELFGLGHVGGSYPHQLSGGQQQRVALARAVAVKPGVLLLDEPLSAVDAKVREELRTEIRRMQVQLGITTILVTHDQSEALSISDRVVVMNRGAIEEIGTPTQIYAEPRSAFTAGFIGAMNEIPVRIVSGANGIVERWGRRVTAPGAAGLPDGDLALLLVRPESLEPLGTTTAALNGDLTLTGQVEVQTFLGATTRLLLRELPGGADDGSALPPTQRLAVDVPSASAGQWPAGSEIAVRIPVAASRVITDRSAERRTRGVQ